MNPFQRLLSGLRGGLSRPPRSEADQRLVVLNVTRQTQLGTSVELAGSGPKRTKGLLGRKGLEPGGGMWIVPCEAVHTIGMQFPIDLVYLDRGHCVRKVRHKVPAGRLSGCLSAHSVIELPAGTVLLTQTQPGDQVEFSPAPTQSATPGAGETA